MEFTRVFWNIYRADHAKPAPRIISNRGGTRSGKTYALLQYLYLLIPQADGAGDVTSVVSETLPHLKRGAIRDFEHIVGHPLKQDAAWNASDLTYTFPSGAVMEFFSADSPGKVMGPARKRLFLNECNHVTFDTYRQLAVRTTETIFLDYNPAALFWAIEEVESRSDCVTLTSTYLDNDHLTPQQVAEIEANKKDESWWKVYGRGELGSMEGRIYQEFHQIDAMPEGDEAAGLVEVWGLDFGYTNDPTTLVRLLVDTKRKRVYMDQRLYRTGMKNGDIAAAMKEEGITRESVVYVDCAEPKSRDEINAYGLAVRSCSKDAPARSEKLQYQLLWMQGWEYFVTKTSLELITEHRNYIWATDANGKPLNYPNDKGIHYDHCLDALRYALWTHFGENAGQGVYKIATIRRHGAYHHH